MLKGANKNHKDRNGITPIDEAKKNKDVAIIAILRNRA